MGYRTKFPNTAIVPGPQISTLRSTVPTAPTAVSWASTGYIDFVADCGADPTGVADCGPALTIALNLAKALSATPVQPETAATIFFPPGLYQFNDTATVNNTFNFTGHTSSLRLTGCGDASIIAINLADAGSFVAAIANCHSIELDHLAFVGSAALTGMAPAGSDTGDVFLLNATWNVHMHHCSIIGLVCNDAAFQATSENCAFNNIVCLASKSAVAGQGILMSTGQLGQGTSGTHIYDCTFVDLGQINGRAIPGGTIDGNAWIYIQGPMTDVLIENCFLDEHAKNGVVLDGTGAGHTIQSARLIGITENGAVSPGAVGAIVAKTVAKLVVDGFTTQTAPAGPYAVLTNVGFAEFRAFDTPAGATAITADAVTGIVRIQYLPSLIPSQILSKAGVTEIYDQIYQGTAAAAGGTFVVNVAIPANQAARLNAEAFLSHVSGAPALDTAGRLVAKCVAENQAGGGAAFVPATAGSANPINSNTAAFAATDPQVADAGFTGAGPPTAVWSVAVGNAVLTVTNPGANIATVAVKIDEVLYGLGP